MKGPKANDRRSPFYLLYSTLPVERPVQPRPVQPDGQEGLVWRCKIVQRHNVDGADGDGQFVLVDHDDDFVRNKDEITMRNLEAASIGKPEGKWSEAVFQALLDLVDHGDTLLPWWVAGKGVVA
jgi:hypothetical protein